MSVQPEKDFHSERLPPSEAARQRRIRSASLITDETHNPCLKESEQSLSCMNENDFDKEKCTLYFLNYRNCRDFWKRVLHDRRGRGVEPALPPPQEREAVREEYYQKWAQRK